MLDAEERAKADETPRRLTRADLKAAELEGLIEPAHLELFADWYQLGGLEKGIGIMELAAMPADMRADLMYLLKEMGRLRRQRKATQPAAKGKKER